MANYANLLATIAANIYTNGNNEVTASMVKTAMDQMVASLGDGYQFAGVATPATNPGTPDQKVFYLASEPGTYTNFGGIVVNTGESCIIKGTGTSWTKDSVFIEKTPLLNPTTEERRRIVGLYLEGLDISKEYYIRYARYYSGGFFQIYVAEKNTSNLVAGYESEIIGDGVIPISEVNGSGVSGFALINMTTADTTNVQPDINKRVAEDIFACPEIYGVLKHGDHRTFIVAADGSGDFVRLRDAAELAIKIPNTHLIIRPGIYALGSEFANEISASQTTEYGIPLGNGMYLHFDAGARVTASYSGSDPNVTKYFAPFFVDDVGGGFTLENANIQAKNTRYCVHDEYSGADVPDIRNRYINCRMSMDNDTAPLNYYPQCIGGGNAVHTYVEIIGCRFSSSAFQSTPGVAVSYHNQNKVTNDFSKIVVRDCYFGGMSTFGSLNYGATEVVSEAWLSNNSFGSAPINANVGGTPPDQPINYANYEWCNEIRS